MSDSARAGWPVYQGKILNSMKDICSEFQVGKETVLMWIERGAPIAVESRGGRIRYSAEMISLQFWRNENFRAGQGA